MAFSVTIQTLENESLKKSVNNTNVCFFLIVDFSRLGCPLPTCSLSNLESALQIGDEIAGDLVRDPMGIGKK